MIAIRTLYNYYAAQPREEIGPTLAQITHDESAHLYGLWQQPR